MFRVLDASSRKRNRLLNDQVRYPCSTFYHHHNYKSKESRCFMHFKSKKCKLRKRDMHDHSASCNTYTSLNHIINCCKFILSGDIETNPGPVFVEPSKTIHAPYSQDNVQVFGTNAGSQCVAMSLCALIYK